MDTPAQNPPADQNGNQPAPQPDQTQNTVSQPPAQPSPAQDPAPAGAEQPAEPAADKPAETPTDQPPAENPPAQPAEGETEASDPNNPKPTTPASTTQPDAPPPPPPNKMKSLLKKGLPIIAVLLVLGAIGGGGYYFWSKKNATKVTDQNPVVASASADNTEASDSAEQQPVSTPVPCVSGYKPYANQQFSICIPLTMNLKEKESTPGAKDQVFVFEDEVQTLTVNTNYADNLNKANCSTVKVVKVSGFQAQRYLIKDDGKTPGTCASTIKNYATLVSSGPEKPLFYIGLQKKSQSFQSDNGTFIIIDQSFHITQP